MIPPKINPPHHHHTHARGQIGFHLARTYQRLYSPEQRRALKWEYRDILKRHGQNTAVRRMHRQIGACGVLKGGGRGVYVWEG